jgi:hypothetical protein
MRPFSSACFLGSSRGLDLDNEDEAVILFFLVADFPFREYANPFRVSVPEVGELLIDLEVEQGFQNSDFVFQNSDIKAEGPALTPFPAFAGSLPVELLTELNAEPKDLLGFFTEDSDSLPSLFRHLLGWLFQSQWVNSVNLFSKRFPNTHRNTSPLEFHD